MPMFSRVRTGLTEKQMDDRTVSGNIAKLVEQLNGELRAAHELGLKVSAFTKQWNTQSGPEQVSVRVWREVTLVDVPAPRLMHIKV